MIKMILVICGIVLSCLPAAAFSSTSDPGYVDTVVVTDSGAVLFNILSTRHDVGSCQGSSLPFRWVINTTTPGGQAQLATVLSAYASRKRLGVNGYNNCAFWGDTESVNYVYTADP